MKGVVLSWDILSSGNKRGKKSWEVALLYIFWGLFGEKCRRAFENCETSKEMINYFLIFWDWNK